MENLLLSLLKISSETTLSSSDTAARTSFQWGGTFSAIFLLILNRVARSSPTQTTLLVAYLISSLPSALFNIVRGEVGYWVAFLAVAAHLFFPQKFPVARFLLLVIIPSCVSHELRDSIVGGILCFIIGVLLLIEEIRGTGGCANCRWNLHCFCYLLGISFLFFFTILYLWEGSW